MQLSVRVYKANYLPVDVNVFMTLIELCILCSLYAYIDNYNYRKHCTVVEGKNNN